MTDFVTICNQYVDDVLTGKILSCVWVNLACKRYRDDLTRSNDDPDYRYYLNDKEVNRYCAFMSLLKHVKGPMAGKPFLLQPFQVFITANIVGWCKRSDGLRRFREICITLPRKSGKSFYVAAYAVAYLCLDNSDHGKEIITAANSEAQAGHVFIPARRMILQSPQLQRAFNIEVNAKSIVRHVDGSRFFPICSLPADGGGYSLACIDEAHQSESTELYDCIKSGQGSRLAPQIIVISTAGTSLSSPLYTWYQDGQKVLEGTTQRDDLFCCFWTIDKEDKWTDWTSVIKATPNLGVSNNIEFLQTEQANAVRSAASQNRFRVKYLCEFLNSSARWLNMQKWHALEDPKLRLVDFIGLPVVAGIDIANKIDISSYCLVFKKPVNGKDHYYVFSHHYLPEERILEADKSHYQKWHHEGWITSTPGNATDHLMVCDDLIADLKAYAVRELCVDPWGTQMLGQKVGAETSAQLVMIPQTTKQLSPIMMELEALVLDGRIHSDGDPVLAWALSNIVVSPDKNDCIYPTKERPDNKIDPAMALLDALSRAVVTVTEPAETFMPFFV